MLFIAHLECLKVVGIPENLAAKYYQDGADEILYMDIVASLYGRNNLVEIVRKASEHIFIPLTVGGGVRSLEDIDCLLRAGADKVAINSWIIENPDFVNKAVKSFGSQCIVGSIEAKSKGNNTWEAFYNNGRESSGKDVVNWALELVNRGVGELLLTSIDKEGVMKGFDNELIAKISNLVKIPVIAGGGAGNLADIKQVIEEGKADAVSVASVLHYNILTIQQIKEEISRKQTCSRA